MLFRLTNATLRQVLPARARIESSDHFEEVVDKRRQEVRNRQLSLAESAAVW